ncbi:hypothetical protein RB202_02975 [Micrococcus yunnanensis]|uniref:hypothetical protein n=1 Tax=Micrococcus yunnanensis TaxID=566027 RepID=UPI0030154776
MTGRGLRTLGLLVTRAVLLVALCGLALSLVGSMSVHQRQYFGAAECGDAVWDVGIGGSGEVWSATEAALTGRNLTLMANGADPRVSHLTGPTAPCLAGVDEQMLNSLRMERGFLVREGSVLADRAAGEGELAGRPVALASSARWRGLPSDGVIQPTPAFDNAAAYVGFLVGDPADLDGFLQNLRTTGLEVDAAPAPTAMTASLGTPVLGVTSSLTGLTLMSVTAFWVLTLRAGERPSLRVLRLLGVSPLRAAVSRARVSLVPFLGAAGISAALWQGMVLTGAVTEPSPLVASGVILVVLLGDAVLVAATHVVSLWMRAPR